LDLAAKKGSVEFTIDTRSIDMGSAAWSAHLKDDDLFNVAQFPTMRFKSDKLIFEDNKVVAAEGQFTMLGVTKPLKVLVSNFQCGISSVDKRSLCSGNVSANIKRSDFGLTKYIPVVSDEVSISVPVDAYKD
jgi:polyisoprenoid-binding protein YceI